MSDRIAALYCRVSTEEQARTGQSIENQIDRLTAYARSQQWPNVEVFADEGESAKNMRRPQMQRLLRLIKSDRVAVVATVAIDRCSRDLLDMLQFVQLCEDHGTTFVCIALNFDTGTPIGRMTLQVLAAFAEFERQMIATRVRSNMMDIAEKKRRYMAAPPFGYRYDDQKRLTIVPGEAVWVQQAADRFIAGHGYRDIARWLNRQGLRTRQAAAWSAATVCRMLTNELYAGQLVYNRRYYDKAGKQHWRDPSEWITGADAHPAIFSKTQWAEITQRARRRMPKGGEKQMKYRLSGLLRCGYCGAAMVSRRYGSKNRQGETQIFVCSNYQKNGSCRFHRIFVAEAEAAVYEALERFAGGQIAIPGEDLEQAGRAAELEYARQMAAIDRKFQRQIQAYENGLIADSDLQLARGRLEKERELLAQERRRVALPAESGAKAGIPREAKRFLWLWEHGELPVLHNTLRRIIDHIVVRDGAIADIGLGEDIYKPEHNSPELPKADLA